MPGVPLQDEARGGALLQFEYYVRLRVDKAWRVPVLYGRLPTKPDDLSPSEDKGAYALFVMLLLRPWRGLSQVDFVRSVTVHGAVATTETQVWDNLFCGVRAMAQGRGG